MGAEGNMSIKVSEKHGVNPSVDHCAICGEAYGVALFGRMKDDQEAPRSVCTGGLCDRCQKAKDKGAVFFIEVAGEEGLESKQRTGRLVGVTEDCVRRVIQPKIQPKEMVEQVLEKGMCFVPVAVFEALGFGQAVSEAENQEGNDGDRG